MALSLSALGAASADADPGDAPGGDSRHRDRHPWDRSRERDRTLREGSPRSVDLDAEHLEPIPGILRAGIENDPQRFSGATLLVARKGRIAFETAQGKSLRWKDVGTQLPEAEQIDARSDTIYDLASISKLFTSVAVMQLVEAGRLSISDLVVTHLPAFAENGKEDVTVAHLLSHVGGLPPFIPLHSRYPDVASRRAAALAVKPTSDPGTAYVYSDLGLITLGILIETLSGQTLDEYVAENITGPLGMDETMYNPPAELIPRIAATEYVAAEGGVVHGHVHDENAWSLGGVAGHAGVFSTARDLAVFAQMLLNGGRYDGVRILEASTVQDMFTDRIAEITGEGGPRRGLGMELAAWSYHAGLTSPYSGGHTGFTGTSLVIDPLTDTFVIMLTNSVHPTREWSTTSFSRRQVSTAVARALGIEPRIQGWHAGREDATTATLTAAVDLDGKPGKGKDSKDQDQDEDEGPDDRKDQDKAQGHGRDKPGKHGAELRLELFSHLEATSDLLTLEASADGGSTWLPLAGTLSASGHEDREVSDGVVTGWGERATWDARFPLVDDAGQELSGEVQVRAAVTTDKSVLGLGVWIGRIRIGGKGRDVLDTKRRSDREAVVSEGWDAVGR